MLKKTRALWILFSLAVCLILPAMIGLTLKTLRLDAEFQNDRQQTELARREAEIQEKITSALYRMDWKLGPYVAREAARPYYTYESFYSPSPSQSKNELSPSPLLAQPGEFVRLHFQIGPDNKFASPQLPGDPQTLTKALACPGVTEESLARCESQIDCVQQISSYALFNEKSQQLNQFNKTNRLGIATILDNGNVYQSPQVQNIVTKFSEKIASNELAQMLDDSPDLNEKSKVQRRRNSDRGWRELVQRQQQYSDQTIQKTLETRDGAPINVVSGNGELPAGGNSILAEEGVMRPLWLGDELFLVRRVSIDGEIVVQACWLAWEKIQQTLRAEVADLLPELEFEKITDQETMVPQRALVTLPVQLVVDTESLLSLAAIRGPKLKGGLTGLQSALILAWSGVFVSVAAMALLLHGVAALSERRASFVSAVTHELRTPLTTFKMYSEMLAEKMVPEEEQTSYAKTLQKEADRLTFLVENVLQFARLERGNQSIRLEKISVSRLVDSTQQRLLERAEEAGFEMSIVVDNIEQMSEMVVEPHVLEQVLFNLVDNACKYASQSKPKKIEIAVQQMEGLIRISVRDYGKGISPKESRRIFQPFHKSDQEAANIGQGVGLGLALCHRMVKAMGGRLFLATSEPGAKFVIELKCV